MANEEEVLAFQITDQDLEDEFNFDRRRPRQSKNRAIYGVWAENSDEEDDVDARPAFGGGRPMAGGFTAKGPVGFVSAGVQQSGKKDESKAQDDEDRSSDEDQARPGPSGMSGRYKKRKTQSEMSGQMAGFRTSGFKANSGLGKGLGEWEKHTRGIGAKLLMKMGYEAGKGLGKNLQGRADIVEAHLRKGRGAIGAYGHEGGGPKAQKGKQHVDSEEEEEKEFKEKLRQWKKGGEREKKIKYVYKTADQVLEDGKWRKVSTDTSTASKVKVIDMTGREERVLSGYHAIGTAKQRPDEEAESGGPASDKPAFEIPELLHNINLILDNCEEELIQADRKLRYHKDRVEVLQVDGEKLARVVEREKDDIDNLNNVLEAVEKLETLHLEKRLDLESAEEMFKTLRDDHPNEYRTYELAHIAVTIVTPLLKDKLKGWQVLDAPFKYKTLYGQWYHLLESADSPESPFYNLVWESWMPSVRMAINLWNTRNPDALIEFLRGWADLIPANIMHNIRDLIVLPKLQSEVSQWDPLTDPVPIHSWLHPWLEILGEQLSIVYPTIRQKLSLALRQWSPSDKSARLILLPWKEVFEKGSLQAFLAKSIVPKLERCLEEFNINPSNQDLSPWYWVTSWHDFLSSASLVSLLDKCFFRRWLQVLGTWLGQCPNYTEIMRWFKGWKEEFAKIPGLLDHQSVQAVINQALQMMNHAVSGNNPMAFQAGAFESMVFLASSQDPARAPGLPQQAPPPPPTMTQQIPQNFRDLVAKRCADRGLIFMPMAGRTHEGKQVYKCGNSAIYIDRNLIFIQRSGMWIYTSLEDLLSNAL